MCKNIGNPLNPQSDFTQLKIKSISLHEPILADNDQMATQNRQFFADRNITTINIMSSPGSGKTSLLTATLNELKKADVPVATIVADQTSDLDAQKLSTTETWVKQINTYTRCHLEARNIKDLFTELPKNPKFLFIENIGNLVCPAAFDLGEQIRVAVLSCTEGEDKLIKYPILFHSAHIIILTKTDLRPYLSWDQDLFKRNLRKINPAARLFEISMQTKEGLKEWVDYLKNL